MASPSLPKLEERVLKFWKKNQIFEKTFAQRKGAKPFRFFEGPPTANADPGFHHVISRVFKDLIPRYKTMQGFYVERKAGWDTHGLPVELQIEKEQGFKRKSDIEKFGIANFNRLAKDSVWRFKGDWEKFTERIGFWLDLKNPYITYETPYIESLWYILKTIWSKKLLEEDYKVVPYCPRCGTSLSSHEVAQGYERVKDPSVYVRFRVKTKTKEWQNTSILSWTTTPWTLPGNVALAVNPKEDYVCVPDPDFRDHWLVLGYKSFQQLLGKGVFPGEYRDLQEPNIDVFKGREMVGIAYQPLFPIKKLISKTSHRILPADFVTMEEGTGVVHTAVMYGEDDFELGTKFKLPKHHTVDEKGYFTRGVREWQGKFIKDVEGAITKNLASRGLLFKEELYEHEYPFCWRCSTPLLYYAHKSWFIRMSKLRQQLIRNNQKINWIPSHLKEGRFGEWLREVKDWALSRERYWGTPLPIWICQKCQKKQAVGSVEELSRRAYGANTFYRMRHGGADHVVRRYVAGWPEKKSMISHLTREGEAQVVRSAKQLVKRKIDLIVSSDLTRMRETVAILKGYLRRTKVVYDPRLREYNTGVFNYKPRQNFQRFFKSPLEKFTKKPRKGETLVEVTERYLAVICDLETKYKGKNILILGHGDPLWALEGRLRGFAPDEIMKSPYPKLGRWEKLPVVHLPHNEKGEVDLHRPYIDAFDLSCSKCNSRMKRVPYVVDVWFDSGAMPFAQWHWPFENEERIAKGLNFPADYIAEAIDQTRGWFYTLLAVATVLGKGPPYLNVISVGHVLDEKGEKMSKSKGNIVDPWEMIRKYGADSLRWYFFTVNPPGEPKKFAERDLAKNHQNLLILLNVLNFWKLYSPAKTSNFKLQTSNLNLLDRWIYARLNQTIKEVTDGLDGYDVRKAALAIGAFIDDLSRWYVRRSRRRFQKPSNKKDLFAASSVLAHILAELSKIMAPFTPFIAEGIWQEVGKTRRKEESVHLATWPKPKLTPRDEDLTRKMQQARDLVALVLKLRAQAGVKVRQPLGQLLILRNETSPKLSKDLLELIQEETNIKKIAFVSALPRASNFLAGEDGIWKVVLDTEITESLRQEGILRELIRQIQDGRQELGLNPQDAVSVFVAGPKEFISLLSSKSALLRRESNARKLQFGKLAKVHLRKELEIGDQTISLGIKK